MTEKLIPVPVVCLSCILTLYGLTCLGAGKDKISTAFLEGYLSGILETEEC